MLPSIFPWFAFECVQSDDAPSAQFDLPASINSHLERQLPRGIAAMI
jgi:hypothetical protein